MSDLRSTSTSISLIQRVQRHDPEAWARFSRLYTPLVYRWARRVNLQDADAGDVVQEVFYSVMTSVERYKVDRGSGFRGWLWGITRNKLLQHQRVGARSPNSLGGSSAHRMVLALPDAPPEELSESLRDLAKRAAQLIRVDFQPKTWQAFWRVCANDEEPARVAEDLGMSMAAVYTAKSRVLAHLRRELQESMED